jgi:hypothetical protein
VVVSRREVLGARGVFLDDGSVKGSTGRMDPGLIKMVEDVVPVLPEGPCERVCLFEDLLDSMRRGSVDANRVVMRGYVVDPLSRRKALQKVLPTNRILRNN